MEDYDNMMSNIRNKATDIRDKIMDWLGFDKLINKETGEIEWKLREGYQKIELIRDILEGIALGALALKLSKLFFTPEQLKRLAETTTLLDKLRFVAGAIVLSIGAVTVLNGLRDNDLKEKLLGILEVGAGAGLMFKSWKAGLLGITIMAELTLALSMVKWTMENYNDVKKGIYGDVEKKLGLKDKLVVGLSAMGEGAMNELAGLSGIEPQSFEQWGQAFRDYWADVEKGYTLWINDMTSKALGFETTWDEFIGTVTDKKAWEQYWEDVKTGAGIWKDDMVTKFNEFKDNVTTKVDETKTNISTKFEETKTNALTKFEELKVQGLEKWNTFKENLATKTDEIKTNTSTKLGELRENALTKFEEIKTKGLEKWEKFKESLSTKVEDIKKNVTDKFEEIKKGISEKIEQAKDKVEEAINKIKSFFSGEYKLNIKVPHFNIDYDTEGVIAQAFQKMGLPGRPSLSVEWYAGGGFPTAGEMFVAREAGPELVGTLNGKNAVANNIQIIEGIKAGVYEAVASAMSEYGGMQIEAKIEEGILLKKVQNQAMQYRKQTGKAPFPTM